MTKQTYYLIYRSGSNSANQPMTFEACPVYAVEAANRSAAIDAALAAGVTCYANQRLEARPASRCSKCDFEIATDRQRAMDLDLASFV